MDACGVIRFRSAGPLASILPKARPGIRFNEHTEGRRPDRLRPCLQARLRRHRFEAAGLALSLGPLVRLDQARIQRRPPSTARPKRIGRDKPRGARQPGGRAHVPDGRQPRRLLRLAASDDAAAAPPRAKMNSRLFTRSPRRRDHLSISCVAWPLYQLTPGNALTFQALHAINFGLRFGGIKLGECVL